MIIVIFVAMIFVQIATSNYTMKAIVTFSFCLSFLCGLSQQKDYKNYFKITAGRILFGTGDVPGYGTNIEYSRTFKASRFVRHFAIGTELSFENGNRQPKVINPMLSEFYSETFY